MTVTAKELLDQETEGGFVQAPLGGVEYKSSATKAASDLADDQRDARRWRNFQRLIAVKAISVKVDLDELMSYLGTIRGA